MYMIIRHMCIQYSRTSCTIYSIDCNLWNLHVFTSVLWHFSVYVTNTKHFKLKILKVNVIWKISTWTVVSGVLNNLHKPIFWELFEKLDKTFKKSAWKNPQADNIEKFFPRICKPGSRMKSKRWTENEGESSTLEDISWFHRGPLRGWKDEMRDLQFLWI